MNRTFKISSITLGLIALLWLISQITFHAGANETKLGIHLRGVSESNISLLPLNDAKVLQAIATNKNVKKGITTSFEIKNEYLPGEFIIRFNYKEKPTRPSKAAEKRIFIAKQDIELWVNPAYINNPDSSWLQDGEKENTTYKTFLKECAQQKNMLGLLQNVLVNYDKKQSVFYREALKEYGKRRKSYNNWIRSQKKEHKNLYVSHLFAFEYVTAVDWGKTKEEGLQGLINKYFDFIDFDDSLLLGTSQLRNFVDQFVNLHAEQITNNTTRDSMLTLAGKRAIEKAKTGHPKLYGWMVDYFFEGFERYNIQAGVSMLAVYVGDTNCLTSKKQAIQKRLEGMETLLPGTIAPDFEFQGMDGKKVKLGNYQTNKAFKLLLFWSADCEHCTLLVKALYPWYQLQQNKSKLDIIAISLDETDTEIPKWEEARKIYPDMIHFRAEAGINSKVANDYFILATPVMVLVDSKTNKIAAMPENIKQLEDEIQ